MQDSGYRILGAWYSPLGTGYKMQMLAKLLMIYYLDNEGQKVKRKIGYRDTCIDICLEKAYTPVPSTQYPVPSTQYPVS